MVWNFLQINILNGNTSKSSSYLWPDLNFWNCLLFKKYKKYVIFWEFSGKLGFAKRMQKDDQTWYIILSYSFISLKWLKVWINSQQHLFLNSGISQELGEFKFLLKQISFKIPLDLTATSIKIFNCSILIVHLFMGSLNVSQTVLDDFDFICAYMKGQQS